MNRCERCGVDLSADMTITSLCKVVAAYLCPKCISEYDQFIRQHPWWKDVVLVAGTKEHYRSLGHTGNAPYLANWVDLETESNRVALNAHAVIDEFLHPVHHRPPDIDWQNMFKRYIGKVLEYEGVTYLEKCDGYWAPAERVAIDKLIDEVVAVEPPLTRLLRLRAVDKTDAAE